MVPPTSTPAPPQRTRRRVVAGPTWHTVEPEDQAPEQPAQTSPAPVAETARAWPASTGSSTWPTSAGRSPWPASADGEGAPAAPGPTTAEPAGPRWPSRAAQPVADFAEAAAEALAVPVDEPAAPVRWPGIGGEPKTPSTPSAPWAPSRSGKRKAAPPTPAPPSPAPPTPAPHDEPSEDASTSSDPHGTAPDAPAAQPAAPKPAQRRRRLAVPKFLDSRLILVCATVVALLVGVGAGAGSSLLLGDKKPVVAPATPEQCAAAQVAWTESAVKQVQMVPDKPETLRAGFIGSSKALDGVKPPAAVAKDWNTVKHYVDTVAAPLGDVDPADGDAVTKTVAATLAALDTQATTAASARVTAYLKRSCAG